MKDVIKYLRKQESGEIDPSTIYLGLCSDLDEKFNPPPDFKSWVYFIAYISPKWQEFSGDDLHPIKSYKKAICSVEMYRNAAGTEMWHKGKYAKSRRRFCGFVADYLEDEK